jgi:NAD(P)-dependent dehydrogenase (short-subunit alcohol dehydrogenase family)
MTRITRKATAGLAMLFATAGAQPRVHAAESPAGPKGARAEIQIGLCAPADRIVQALDLHGRGTPMEVWQFDDAALTLFERGLRLRVRVTADGRSEFTLKVANQDCARLDPRLVPPGEGKCEYNVYGTSKAGAVSLTRSLTAKSTKDLLGGRLAPAQALSPSQLTYLREVVGIWPLPPGIRGLGPMQVWTYRTKGKLYDVEISRLPDGEQFAEISRKVPLADANRSMGAMEADLSRSGVEMCADQSSQAINKLRALLR